MLTFEDKLQNLNKLTSKASNPNLTLEESLTTFDEAIKAAQDCIDEINTKRKELNILKLNMDQLSQSASTEDKTHDA
ncbi:MAG: exodeoxyribonuclease VII small subunit [Christensenellaceae bacterium]|jgi:exodeoxyribonuclease VII small subunit|nr:exodeoxyribonuclease VII small subunit [Christensenellaceae bacterium]